MSRLEEIQARADAATPGPWEVDASDAGHSRYEMNVYVATAELGDVICDMDGLARSYNEKYDSDGYDDATFIAHAREDVPWLLDRVRHLEAELAKVWDDGWEAGRAWVASGHPALQRNPHRSQP